jgi:hypothetical protein
MAELMGLEPTTFRVTGGRSDQTELQLHTKYGMAPRAGFEPATQRLTVVCSATELPRNKNFNYNERVLNCGHPVVACRA